MENKISFIIFLSLLYINIIAQTGGPGQPEFSQFQQAGTSNLVNPATGSFSYQIPLFKVGGYPMNLTYQSGIQMEDVASMVGLGWNLNAGSIVRNLRGLPDDFNNDKVIKEFSIKDNTTFGGKVGVDLEITGLPLPVNVGASLGVFYNNYKGWGMEPSLNGSLSAPFLNNDFVGGNASLGLGIGVNSQSGVDKYISPSVGFRLGKQGDNLSLSLGKTWSVNSNEGLKTSLNTSLSMVKYNNGSNNTLNKDGDRVSVQDQSSMSLLGFSRQSYLNNLFQPDIEYPFENISGTFSGTLGFDVFYVDPNIRITGYFSKQRLATKMREFFAVGSLYEKEKVHGVNEEMDPNTLMDFNREKKLPYYIGQSKVLPIPYKTPDIFNLNAQGLSMTFSLNKNDNVVVGDARTEINSIGVQTGFEGNFGNLIKIGGNLGVTSSFQQSGRWAPFSLPSLTFNGFQSVTIEANGNKNLYQHNCFKNHSEINKYKSTIFDLFGGYNPVKFDVINEALINLQSLNNINITELFNKVQPVRQSTINYLTAYESSNFGFDRIIKYYRFSDRNAPKDLERINGNRLGHHISEIIVTQPDGMKYVFGIPVYNTMQKEVTFNVGKVNSSMLDLANNLVPYTSGYDNSTNNKKGIDEFYESTTTPPYATQFLITAVLSPEYRDITNDGISPDDNGNYVKFNYFKEDFNTGQDNACYNWRTPFRKDYATYNRGLRSDEDDDKGTYVFGQKELWYIHSMESKTEKAEFYYSMRKDGLGVEGENGGKNSDMYLRKLDSVKIYTLSALENASVNEPTSLKTIHFEYDYSLCPNTENANSSTNGKLTLKQVYFTYENSQKGKLTPYIFDYGNSPYGNVNPEYILRNVNRWSYYQKNPENGYSDCFEKNPLDGTETTLSNIDYPYSSQNSNEMNKNAYAWNLTNITIPGGGELTVNYESNDYAFVQDKTAGQMFIVQGLTSPDMGNSLYNSTKIYFERFEEDQNLNNPNFTKEDLKKKYIQDIFGGYLYYKFYVNLKTEENGKKNFEYITGYAKITDDFDIYGDKYAFITLQEVDLDEEKNSGICNPILKSALQFMRINRSKLIYSQVSDEYTPALDVESNPLNAFSSFAYSLPTVLSELKSQLEASNTGINLFCKTKDYCNEVDLKKSFIRLYNPRMKKLSGGSRVSIISINDKWDAMTGNTHEGKSYTTHYTYILEDKDPVNPDVPISISSGVTDYEPLMGGDEISLKQPIIYFDIKKKAPDTEYYVETPINESNFPAPQIIYSKVTQTTNKTNLDVSKTGKVVNEFFTAKDYPVKVQMTTIDEKRDKTNFNTIQPPFLAIDQQHDFATVSQGYSIELNYMSGLPKATWVFNEKGDRISGEVSEYFSDNDNFTTIDKYGNINYNTQLGLSVDYTIDGRKSYDRSQTNILQANFNASNMGPITIPVVMPLFSEMTEEKQFQSIVINKIIHRNGILKRKIVFDQSASVTTENIAFDEITGESLLTKTTNEFNDSLYSFKYPAYWMYEGMGPSYENSSLKINNNYPLQTFKEFLKVGDELRGINVDGILERLWVQNIHNNPITFVRENRYLTTTSLSGNYQVYNSGAKNLLSNGAGQVVTWKYNPLQYGEISETYKIKFVPTNILNSSAIQYYDSSIIHCDSCRLFRDKITMKNDFLSGVRGNWKPKRTWFYLTDRTPNDIDNGKTDIRTEGLFKDDYNDFWVVPNNNSDWTINYDKWEWKEKVNITDIDGQTIETEDRIGRKVSNLLGFRNTLVLAQAFNSGYGESYYEGFEDLDFTLCPNKLKRVRNHSLLSVNCDDSHTGKYSLEVSQSFNLYFEPSKGCDTLYNCVECKSKFVPNKKYLFSCWVKVNKQQPILTCDDASVNINIGGTSKIMKPEGPVVEGWQRIQDYFLTPSDDPPSFSITLKPGTANTLYDDIRIIADSGNMVSYVYDDLNLRLTEILDENNYFTKYEYNNQGELIRIKKESERGILTIKEGNQSLRKFKLTVKNNTGIKTEHKESIIK
jgi:hypothetical protein